MDEIDVGKEEAAASEIVSFPEWVNARDKLPSINGDFYFIKFNDGSREKRVQIFDSNVNGRDWKNLIELYPDMTWLKE